MNKRDPILTPELIKILKIFIFSSLLLVVGLSFFDGYRANNSGEDRTFRVTDSNRIYFQNVRAIHYEREVRQDAGMTLYRHRKRTKSDTLPTLDLVIILNPLKDEAYCYFELANADWPIQLRARTVDNEQQFDFANGNNADHFDLFQRLVPQLEPAQEFELIWQGKSYPLWRGAKEIETLKTVSDDYLRLLNLTN